MENNEWTDDFEDLIFKIKKQRELTRMRRNPSLYMEELLSEELTKEIDKEILKSLMKNKFRK